MNGGREVGRRPPLPCAILGAETVSFCTPGSVVGVYAARFTLP